MGMTIEEIKAKLDKSNIDSDTLIELTRYLEKYDLAITSMRKYQKIKEQVDIAIDTENFAISGARLIQIREIIDGNDD